ncbi:MAG: hypothetical protein E7268_06510 [Lachnospiraceae bacterium]|nr:hypothetical protein [Lachnospiraceae bacterium]
MKQRVRASMTVEAALLYPMMLLIVFLLVKLTVYRYVLVQQQAAELYDEVFHERTIETSQLIRISDTAFDFFSK